MIYLDDAKELEKWRSKFEKQMNSSADKRNWNIYESFKHGCRQKEIANALGLSESTIKHIIARMKKNESI